MDSFLSFTALSTKMAISLASQVSFKVDKSNWVEYWSLLSVWSFPYDPDGCERIFDEFLAAFACLAGGADFCSSSFFFFASSFLAFNWAFFSCLNLFLQSYDDLLLLSINVLVCFCLQPESFSLFFLAWVH